MPAAQDLAVSSVSKERAALGGSLVCSPGRSCLCAARCGALDSTREAVFDIRISLNVRSPVVRLVHDGFVSGEWTPRRKRTSGTRRRTEDICTSTLDGRILEGRCMEQFTCVLSNRCG